MTVKLKHFKFLWSKREQADKAIQYIVFTLPLTVRLELILAFCFITALVSITGCDSQRFSTKGKEWKSLFNGKDLSGWIVKCKPGDRDKEFWSVENGTILADSMGRKKHDYVWLVTKKEYSDFILRLRFQAYRGSPGNSGVQIRSRYDDEAGWLDGPQVDINPPGPWRTGMIWDETRGVKHWLYPKVPKGKWVDKSMANQELIFYYSGEEPSWNELEITAVGTRLSASLNGVIVMEYDGEGVLNDDIHKSRNVGLNGHIALQIHTNDELKIRFKDIYIKDMSGSKGTK
ncbi:MAG: DUF1080 domain-containing protein [Phycisphaerae bacterium]|nr:DUF1080 domain-containing protein [Fodinibius sp.]NIU57841.1 DUF1080 domain-containing protein [Phycisphaerae bacterium]NIV12481.1 DUF1080 domain-containing protein [Fodinibius sp.]NIW94279.1 DUF1080 domain-containing protein [Phycisphaerae bacterium]NIY26169.1 DUF1080 domain-containing protein [Fodinibius sp.]